MTKKIRNIDVGNSRAMIPALLGAAGLAVAPIAEASTILTAVDQGWYRANGTHTTTNTNYVAGYSDAIRRNFFVFSVPALAAGEVFTSAVLSLQIPSGGIVLNSFPAATFELREFSGLVSALVAGTGGVGAFSDLGSGSLLGSFNFTVADANTTAHIALNQAGLDALLAAQGGSFALGGSVPAAEAAAPIFNYIFGLSHEVGLQTLTFESGEGPPSSAIPEPGSAIALGCLLGLGLTLRVRRKKD